MATPPRVGDQAVHADGRVVQWNGETWAQVSGPTNRGGAAAGRSRIPPPDIAEINRLRDIARGASDIERTYNRTGEAIQRLRPGPWRGAFLEAAIPDEGGGWMDAIGSAVVGIPARLTGAISRQDVNDYQAITRAQAEGTLARQLQQRGVQTESDAARMALAELSTRKTPETSGSIISQGVQQALRLQARAAFYNDWASRFGGITGTHNTRGATVEQAWNELGDRYTQQFLRTRGGNSQRPATPRARPTIRRVR